MSTDRPTEILAAWDEVTRSAQAPHQPASLRSRVVFPGGALVLGSVVLALLLALPLLQGTLPRGGGALSSGSPTVAQTNSSAVPVTPAATQVIESDCPGGTVAVGSPPETPEFLAVVRAVNRDPDNFDSIYVDPTGIVVIEYVGDNAGRPAVEEKIPAGMQVRWQQVRYSRTELRRIQDEIMERHLAGVWWAGSGNACNAVTVGVDAGSIDEIRRLLAETYGDAVHVVTSGPVIAQ